MMENPIKMDDLGVFPLFFGNTHMLKYTYPIRWTLIMSGSNGAVFLVPRLCEFLVLRDAIEGKDAHLPEAILLQKYDV